MIAQIFNEFFSTFSSFSKNLVAVRPLRDETGCKGRKFFEFRNRLPEKYHRLLFRSLPSFRPRPPLPSIPYIIGRLLVFPSGFVIFDFVLDTSSRHKQAIACFCSRLYLSLSKVSAMIPLFGPYALRPLQPGDTSDIFRAIDTQRPYLGLWLPFVALTLHEEDTRAFVGSALADTANPVYTIRAGALFAGLIGFKSADPVARTIEIGYWLCEEYQPFARSGTSLSRSSACGASRFAAPQATSPATASLCGSECRSTGSSRTPSSFRPVNGSTSTSMFPTNSGPTKHPITICAQSAPGNIYPQKSPRRSRGRSKAHHFICHLLSALSTIPRTVPDR